MGHGYRNSSTGGQAVAIPAWLVTIGEGEIKEFRNEQTATSFARKISGSITPVTRDAFDPKPGQVVQGWSDKRQQEVRGKWTGSTRKRPDRLMPSETEIWTEVLVEGESVWVIE